MNSTILVVMLLLVLGLGLAVAGVYLLAGPGWALLTAASGPLGLASVILRGARRG
ncbi:hypothetical protein [Marilutibacter spongiae]|uniref:Uncharacterized protein n=1 Tax=Marilutibacter spongiae TaxID=2025720 RepID=A0A7W3TLB1_9GAMM|nr:hypothetical protein [Lysobacter spongiae]MBB1060416.1 hypothetical protein [Lysobacter spongiae]